MRKFFFGLGVLAAVLIVLGGAGFYMLNRSGDALDRASKAYAERSVVAIAANWNADELWKRASPHLRQIATYRQIRGLFVAANAALGPMLEFSGSKGEAVLTMGGSHPTVSAQYVAAGSFQKGKAEFRISLVEQHGKWEIEGFHILSSALMKRLTGIAS